MAPVRVAVTGITGQLGRALLKHSGEYFDIVGTSSVDVDVRHWSPVRDWIASVRPDIVIHAAAMTDVDGCESRTEEAYSINALGTRHVAAAADRVGATLAYISTNFVFDGEQEAPYHEFDHPNPISVYGASKLAGEVEASQSCRSSYVIRTSMVFDESGRNFVNTMINLMRSRETISVVDDQFGNPTYAPDLAIGVLKLVQTRPPGTYHLTNSGSTSWHDWAVEIAKIAALECEILPIDADSFPRAATPPANGILTSLAWPEQRKLMPHWRDALARCLA